MKPFPAGVRHKVVDKKIAPVSLSRALRLTPLASAVAVLLIAGGAGSEAYAQRAFSPGWFADKVAGQNTASQTGRLANGMPASSLTSPLGQQQRVNEQLKRSVNNLNLAARGIAAQQAAQEAARRAAGLAPSDVPDGLAEGGLKVDTNSLTAGWLNANAPVQSVADGRTNVAIQQTADKAILNWETFNVGKNTTVDFKQQANWAVLNRINDALMRPSQIQGQIKGDGTVLVVNRNGIVFSGSSQVDTRNLIAAAGSISKEQFENNGIYSAMASGQPVPSFTDALGKVEVQAGARITTKEPGSVTQGGGYVLLMGREVSNAGEITTRKGQAALVAGDSFSISKGVGTDGNSASTTRGNEVTPQFTSGSTAGSVRNTGLILAREGDVTLAGRDVQQYGTAIATTTVNTRGTVHLLNAADDTLGKVTLGANAVTAVLIEDDGKTTALDSQRDALIKDSPAGSDRRDQSRIEITSGGNVHFEGDSLTLATGGQIVVNAGSRAFVADRAQLDVSGAVGVNVAMESNNVLVNIQGNELRDSPLNRDGGALFNNNVWVDRRNLVLVPAGTGGYETDRWYAAGGLLEVGGYLSNQGHGIGEWSAQGGTITLGGKEVITQQGSSINLSGGTLDVQTGYVNQTWLKGSDGRLYSLSKAPADMVFDGVYKGYEVTHARWGKENTEYFYNPLIAPSKLLENGYTVGRDAGRLIVNAPTAVLEGGIVADVFNGARQTRARDAISDGYKQAQTAVAMAGQLVLGSGMTGTQGQDTEVIFAKLPQRGAATAADGSIDPSRLNTSWLDSDLLNSFGLGGIDVSTINGIAVNDDLKLAHGGRLSLSGLKIDIAADITARGGDIRLSNAGFDGAAQPITLHSGATLDVRGVSTNIQLAPSEGASLAFVNGGNATLTSEGALVLEQGTLIDASSGAAILAKGKIKGGKGGNVTLVSDDRSAVLNGGLTLDGEIRSYGVSGGGKLSIQTGRAIVISGQSEATSEAGNPLQLAPALFRSGFGDYEVRTNNRLSVSDGTALVVEMPVYRLNAQSLNVASGADPASSMELWTPPAVTEDPVNRALTQRDGASLTLAASTPGATAAAPSIGGPLTLGHGASITVDAGQKVRLDARGQITIDGAIVARGGKVTIVDTQRGAELRNGSYDAGNQSIWLGENSRIDVSGQAWQARDARGRSYGLLLAGGSVLIGSEGGETNSMGLIPSTQAFIIQRVGSVIDASGASLAIDNPQFPLTGPTDSLLLASDGGTIALNSSTGIFLDGTLAAHKGGASASGGTLSIALETPLYSGIGSVVNPNVLPDALNRVRVITVAQQHGPGQLASGLTAGAADSGLVAGARIGVDQIAAGGFDSLALRSRDLIRFEGNVSLQLGRSLELGGVIASSSVAGPSTVDVYTPYLLLSGAKPVGSPSGGTDYYAGLVWGPSFSSWGGSYRGSETTLAGSSLTLSGGHIDVQDNVLFGVSARQGVRPGNGSLPNAVIDEAGFADVNLVSGGDIRFMTSNLASGGDITLTAAQLYPATNAVGMITAGHASGMTNDQLLPGHVLAIRRNASIDPAVPYSIFGSLGLFADIIEQGGVVRAPLGLIEIGTTSSNAVSPTPFASEVRLLPGSLTSVSTAGLVMPFGGTTDGQKYAYGGVEYTMTADGSLRRSDRSGVSQARTVQIGGSKITIEDGAIVDLSGGGDLLGAAFATGRGGSIDVLQAPLAAVGPGYGLSSLGNKVYAIVPGYAGVAPVVPDAKGGTPRHGQQITLPQSLPGLPAGTYTLLPATFATIPGAFRVEVGPTDSHLGGASAFGNGSYVVGARLGIANAGMVNGAPSQVILTPAKVVETLSGYNRTSYDAFVASQAATFGNMRGATSADAGILKLVMGSAAADRPLTIQGDVRMDVAEGGRGGIAQVQANGGDVPIEIRHEHSVATSGYVSLVDSDLNSLSADTLLINGGLSTNDNGLLVIQPTFNRYVRSAAITLRTGSALSAPQIIVVAGGNSASWTDSITMEAGAMIDTTGHGAPGLSADTGFSMRVNDSLALLAVSNGLLDIRRVTETSSASQEGASLILNDGAVLRSRGSVALSAPNQLTIGAIDLSARDMNLALNAINIGSAGDLASAAVNGVLPSGWTLTQQMVDQLLRPTAGRTQLERLTLTTRDSLNLFGSVELNTIDPATGKSSVELALVTPAIYGLGTDTDVATIRTDRLIWNGRMVSTGTYSHTLGSGAPGPVLPGGAGTGTGKLALVADEIVFGFNPQERPQNEPDIQRLTLGFSAVDVTASQRITANNKGTLNVYRSGTDAASYAAGDLNLITPLLTGAQGSMMTYKAGGSISITAPAGSAVVETLSIKDMGGELRFDAGGALKLDTTVALPSGRLALNAADDIVLGDRATIDLAGRKLSFFDIDKYSWGGDLLMESANGAIVQGAGSVIDVSAVNNDAGTIQATATGSNGAVTFIGQLLGQSTASYDFGGFDVRTRATADFADLNAKLNTGGFFGSRGFQIKTGNLVVGDEVRANQVSISVDGGSLTVNGRIDASGVKPGTIRLAARDDLMLASSAVLDVHATQLHTDSYGAPIEAKNRGRFELTSVSGFVTLAQGTTIDLRSADSVARGKVEINARRLGGAGADGTGDGANDTAVNAANAINILGAKSIAVNGFRSYTPADGIINQGMLDTIHDGSSAFIDAALANSTVGTRLAGLSSYRDAFHLRPGVEIRSNGDLRVEGDLDLSGYRYASVNPNTQKTSVYGSGEVGTITVRAAGDITIKGSITDGFGLPAATPDDNGWGVLLPTGRLTAPITLTAGGVVLAWRSALPNEGSVNFGFTVDEYTEVRAGSTLPANVSVMYASLPAGTKLTAAIRDSDGNVLYAAGTILSESLELFNGEVLGAGFVVGSAAYLQLARTFWPAGASLSVFQDVVMVGENTPLPAGSVLPAGMIARYVGAAFAASRPIGTDGAQGKIYAVAPLLAGNAQSWSLRLAAGSDVTSADPRALTSKAMLHGGGNLVLDDSHFTGPTLANQALSVIRTGIGDLELLAGGNYRQNSLFGIYTAGSQSSGIDASHQLGLNLLPDGTVLGVDYSDAANPGNYYAGALSSYRAWYPDHGGDLNVTVQGDLSGYTSNAGGHQRSDPTNWLWRQGGIEIGQKAAWWINFGTYASRAPKPFALPVPTLVGFSGFGALGGGNVNLKVGGDAGVMSEGTSATTQLSGLDVSVGGSGRVLADGSLLQTGGGDLTIRIGGALNRGAARETISDSSGMYLNGVITNLRGDTDVTARSIGSLAVNFGGVTPNDPRPVGDEPATAAARGGVYLALGDSAATLRTRGDLVLGTVLDPGRQRGNATSATVPGNPSQVGNATSWFTLWTEGSAVEIFSAGGNLTPNTTIGNFGQQLDDRAFYYPGTLRAVAAGGNIYGRSAAGGQGRPLELAPFANAAFELLARGSIYGNGGNDAPLTFAISGADSNLIATPFRPAYQLYELGAATNDPSQYLSNNAWDGAGPIGELFRYDNDNATGLLHANNPNPARVYAATGDIEDFRFGYSYVTTWQGSAAAGLPASRDYASGKPLSLRAGRDIVSLGSPIIFGTYGQESVYQSTLIVHGNPLDVSTIQAGRDIFYANVTIAGPGTLDVSAGRNIYQGGRGTLHSIGPIGEQLSADARAGGAGISVMAGIGTNGPAYAEFAQLYLDPANLADPFRPLADQEGKVAKTYADELAAWLKGRYNWSTTDGDPLAYFRALSPEQQGIFLRKVYFEELRQGGREYNDAAGRRFGSYLRGRQAIAALFPHEDATGKAIAYAGDITMFGERKLQFYDGGVFAPVHSDSLNPVDLDGAILTDFGGDVQVLTPGGGLTIGVDGVRPVKTAGLLTQGSGDVQVFAKESIRLGLSRAFTTFGGDITMWSVQGDINAGRGAKTTTVYAPARRVYDQVGNVTLSPTVPTSGAGIGTLNPIPEVPAGDVDLIAPLGTIDAGEAGIRVSGNVNIAALHVVNVENIQVQGESTGIPTVATVNVAALTNASAAASQAAGAAQEVLQRERATARQNLPSIFTVRVLGFGNEPMEGGSDGDGSRPRAAPVSYDSNSSVRVLGVGDLPDSARQKLTARERSNLGL